VLHYLLKIVDNMQRLDEGSVESDDPAVLPAAGA
jgi:hypothetical protein